MGAQPLRQYRLAFCTARERSKPKKKSTLSQESSKTDKLTPSYSLSKEYGIFSTEYITQILPPLLLSQRLGRSQKSLPRVYILLQGIFSASRFSNGSVALTKALNHPDDVIRYSLLSIPPKIPPRSVSGNSLLHHVLGPQDNHHWKGFLASSPVQASSRPLCTSAALLTSHAFLYYTSEGISYKWLFRWKLTFVKEMGQPLRWLPSSKASSHLWGSSKSSFCPLPPEFKESRRTQGNAYPGIPLSRWARALSQHRIRHHKSVTKLCIHNALRQVVVDLELHQNQIISLSHL